MKKEQSYQNNNNNYLQKSYTEKKSRHEPSGWAMFTRCLFDEKENKLNYYRRKDCIEKLCKKLKRRAMKIINYEEKEMILPPLTKEENKSYKKQVKCHICEEKCCMDRDDENYINRKKVIDQCHYIGKFRGATHSKYSLNYKVPKDIPIIIHNTSYDTHFIINQLAQEFEGKLNCIGENMKKYITFLYQLRKNVLMVKKLHINLGLLIVLDLCQLHYQNLSGIFNSIECKSCIENNRY